MQGALRDRRGLRYYRTLLGVRRRAGQSRPKALAATMARIADEARFRAARPRHWHRFFIVSAGYNVEGPVERHLRSVREQRYPPGYFEHLLIDDASTDRTLAVVEDFSRRFPDHPLHVDANAHNLGGCANYTRAFRSAPAKSLVLQLDADDWLFDRDVLRYLNLVYQDPHVWMTYNTWVSPEGEPGVNCMPVPPSVIGRLGYRDISWHTSHLHSFRAELFSHVRDESMRDPATGDYWRAAVDMAQYLPMLELAGHHARHIHRPMYVYNMHAGSIELSRRQEQLACEQRIRAGERYRPLTLSTLEAAR